MSRKIVFGDIHGCYDEFIKPTEQIRITDEDEITGTIIVTLVYVLINFAYLYMLPILSIRDSKAVAADAMNQYFTNGGQIIAVLIMVSIFGTISIYTMSAP